MSLLSSVTGCQSILYHYCLVLQVVSLYYIIIVWCYMMLVYIISLLSSIAGCQSILYNYCLVLQVVSLLYHYCLVLQIVSLYYIIIV